MPASRFTRTIVGAEAVIRHIGQRLAWLNLLMVAGTLSIVVLRYGFSISLPLLQESVMYAHALVFMLGMAFTLQVDEHVRVDIVYQRLSQRGRCWVNLWGSILLLVPMLLFIGWESIGYVALSWQSMETSQEAGGLAYVYLLKTLIPVMVVLLLCQALLDLIGNIYYLLWQEFPFAAVQRGMAEPGA
jgi:TRAP-type mannitol/chloroaromatic compound transport system permease small subunit